MSSFFKDIREFYSSTENILMTILAIVCLISGNAAQIHPLPGSLNLAFDGEGKVVANLGNSDNIAGSVAMQPGKIVIVGLTGAIETRSETPARRISSCFATTRTARSIIRLTAVTINWEHSAMNRCAAILMVTVNSMLPCIAAACGTFAKAQTAQ